MRYIRLLLACCSLPLLLLISSPNTLLLGLLLGWQGLALGAGVVGIILVLNKRVAWLALGLDMGMAFGAGYLLAGPAGALAYGSIIGLLVGGTGARGCGLESESAGLVATGSGGPTPPSSRLRIGAVLAQEARFLLREKQGHSLHPPASLRARA